MPISCHFRDCKALLFESRKQRYNKYPGLYLLPLRYVTSLAHVHHDEIGRQDGHSFHVHDSRRILAVGRQIE